MAAKKTTRTSHKQRRQGVKLPSLEVLLTCDAVSRDPNTGKPTLYGIFDQFVIRGGFPAKGRPFSIYVRLVGGSGTQEISIEVLGPDGKKLVGTSGLANVHCKPNQNTELIGGFTGLIFAKPGKHQILIRSGKRRIGKPISFEVKREKAT